jgi:hypothetical protein
MFEEDGAHKITPQGHRFLATLGPFHCIRDAKIDTPDYFTSDKAFAIKLPPSVTEQKDWYDLLPPVRDNPWERLERIERQMGHLP